MKLQNCHNPRTHISKKDMLRDCREYYEGNTKLVACASSQNVWNPYSTFIMNSSDQLQWQLLTSFISSLAQVQNKYIKSTQNTWQTIIENLCPEFLKHVQVILLASPPPNIEMALPMVWQKSLNYTIFPTHISYRSSPWRRDTTVGVSMQQTHPIWFSFLASPWSTTT